MENGMNQMTSIEFCAGAGGQALGLEQAGFRHLLLVDNDPDCCRTLRLNRPFWDVRHADMNTFILPSLGPVDLFAAGLPCPPFSIAGKQLGSADERNLFPAALRLIEQAQPRAVLIENVRGFLSSSFTGYRQEIARRLDDLGYLVAWKLFDSLHFGLPQTRSRVAIVAFRKSIWPYFAFPEPDRAFAPSVGHVLRDLMAANGWNGAEAWVETANGFGPTIVGGSKKHGGPDLGPTRARTAWRKLGVNGGSIAEQAPEPGFGGMPRLTNRMVARLQGFPDAWQFSGGKTAAYRQIGNAFPPPVAQALGKAVAEALTAHDRASFQPGYAAE
jgi:DNA (cytosine-5)-methyltransferase 1